MSYLELPKGVPEFKKAVISFWFRVPQASIDATYADYTGEGGPLEGVIPLVVIGKSGTGSVPLTRATKSELWAVVSGDTPMGGGVESHYTVLATDTWTLAGTTIEYVSLDEHSFEVNPNAYFEHNTEEIHQDITYTVAAGPAPPTSPFVIGLLDGSLYINIETGKIPNVVGFYEVQSFNAGSQEGPGGGIIGGPSPGPPGDCDAMVQGGGSTITSYSSPVDFGGTVVSSTSDLHWVPYPVCPAQVTQPTNNWVDISNLSQGESGAIEILPNADITADEWHHVLISIDLSTIATHGTSSRADEIHPITPYLDSWSRVFVAIDDKNYAGNDLGAIGDVGLGDPNAVFTSGAMNVAGAIRSYDSVDGEDVPVGVPARYSLDPVVPNGVLGIPAHAGFVDRIKRVEIAEFQMFTGVTLDTSVEKNRRLFITEKDKKGRQYPVNPTPVTVPLNKQAVGDPVTWEPGADWPAFVPGLFDPTAMPTKNEILGTAAVDFTKSSLNWIMGRNLGTAEGKVETKGVIKQYHPDPVIESGGS